MSKLILLGVLSVGTAVAGCGLFWPWTDIPHELALPGIVEIHEVHLSSRVGGRVRQVLVQEGDTVREHQPLVVFETDELHSKLSQATAQLRAATAARDRVLNGPRPEEKQSAEFAAQAANARLKRLMAGHRQEEKENARIDVSLAEESLTKMRKDLERQRQFIFERATSSSALETAEWNLARAQNQLSLAKNQLKVMEDGYRSEEIQEAGAEASRLQAQWNLIELGSRDEDKAETQARVDELRAKVQEIELAVEEAIVKAFEVGTVEVLAVRPGEVVPPNQPVVRMLRTNDLSVKVYVPETQLGKVQLHSSVELSIDSHGKQRFTGRVTQIASASEYTPRNVQSIDERHHQVFAVKIRVTEAPKLFKSGMSVDAFLPLQ